MKPNSPTKIRRELGRRFADLRLGRGWTQEKLAEKLGVSVRYLQAVEAGDENLTIETLCKVGDALGASVSVTLATEPVRVERATTAKRVRQG